jgi:protein arginine kinase activator
MLCERCNKNQATVIVENSTGNMKSTYHLCAECAGLINNQLSIAGIIGSLLSAAMAKPVDEAAKVRCKTCGLSLPDFIKRGKFGCADCYSSFEPQTERVLVNVHGQAKHSGKIPGKLQSRYGFERELSKLKTELTRAIAEEEYESAAVLRDKIKNLKERSESGEYMGQSPAEAIIHD